MPRYKFDQIAINSTEKKKPVEEDKYNYLGLDHLEPGNLRVSKFGTDVAPIGEKLIMRKGDVLFGKRRAYQKKVAIAPFDGIFSAHGMVLRPRTDIISPRLFPFFISSNHFLEEAIKISVGSLSPTINWRDLRDLEFNIPSIDKQDLIADQLWAMEETKEAYKKLLESTDALVKSQFIEMFGDPNKAINAARLEEAFEIRDDLRKPLNDTMRFEMQNGDLYPYYGANGQIDRINDYLMDCTALCLAEDCGAYGPGEATSYIITGKSWVNNHAHVLIPRECCNIEFANMYFKILDISSYVSGTTRLKLTQGKLKEIPFILPPIEVQIHFSDFVRQSDKSKFVLLNNI